MKDDKTLRLYTWAAGAVAIDQLTKLAARAWLKPDQPVSVIPSFFDLKLSYNSGGAFGVLPDWAPLFIIAALAAIYAIVRLGKVVEGSKILATGLGLLMGGATGNLVDRLTSRFGSVTDFLSFYVTIGSNKYAWPTFNVADIAIVAGAVMVVFYVYTVEKKR
ncbi:MAG: signal peptidase II [Armatimonadetes bacterium]|nr:signal peptidase II [Armatimonadota bacterium]